MQDIESLKSIALQAGSLSKSSNASARRSYAGRVHRYPNTSSPNEAVSSLADRRSEQGATQGPSSDSNVVEL